MGPRRLVRIRRMRTEESSPTEDSPYQNFPNLLKNADPAKKQSRAIHTALNATQSTWLHVRSQPTSKCFTCASFPNQSCESHLACMGVGRSLKDLEMHVAMAVNSLGFEISPLGICYFKRCFTKQQAPLHNGALERIPRHASSEPFVDQVNTRLLICEKSAPRHRRMPRGRIRASATIRKIPKKKANQLSPVGCNSQNRCQDSGVSQKGRISEEN